MSSRWLALPIVLVAVFMTTLDFFVANVAIPSIRADLGTSAATGQLVIACYGLAYAAGLIISGRLGDLYGSRRVFAAGLALFTAASAACGLAPAPGPLVLARVAQGVAAALLAPQVLTLIGELYPGRDRARAFGWYGTAVGLAGVSGQVIGGFLVAVSPAGLGWRTCFLVNLPVGVAALALLPRLVPRLQPVLVGEGVGKGVATTVQAPAREVDFGGALMVAGGLVAVVLPLALGREQGWPWWSWLSLGLAGPVLLAFARRQRRLAAAGRPPLLDLGVFGERGFARGLLAIALLFGGSAGLSFVLALYLQDGLGMSPLRAGAVAVALNVGFFAASTRSARLAARLGRWLPVAGTLVLLGGLGLLYQAVDAAAGPYPLVGALLVTGAGMGLLMSPLVSAALSGVRAELAGAAAGVLGTVQEMGGVLGGTLAGTVFLGALGEGWAGAARAGLAVLIGYALVLLLLVLRRA
ncbi:MFS transporter [Nonomuraea sediminis]|uniref:MFS transporter n=1 Tax=Nonomuraea sediminis TaxID=2835864 RepID=UPI001BDD684C|nr:MFS transporter [Nonomuraea sediminis]